MSTKIILKKNIESLLKNNTRYNRYKNENKQHKNKKLNKYQHKQKKYLFITLLYIIMKLDKQYFEKLLDQKYFGWDLTLAEATFENDLTENYDCKQSDYNYRKNSILQTFEDLYRVIQQCSYFLKWRAMEDLLIQSWLYMEELLKNNREEKEPVLPF